MSVAKLFVNNSNGRIGLVGYWDVVAFDFVVNYLAEILRSLRNHDYSQLYHTHFDLFADISNVRPHQCGEDLFWLNEDTFPPPGKRPTQKSRNCSASPSKDVSGVKDQLMRIDSTYANVRFGYRAADGSTVQLKTLEEELYPRHYTGSASSTSAEVEGQARGPNRS